MAKLDPKKLANLEHKIKIELFTTLPFLILSVAIPISAWYGVFQYDPDVKIWFQRSGSLMVLFAVWLEYKLFKVSALCNSTSEGGVSWQDLAHRDALIAKYGNKVKTYKYITAVLAISGTVIWGYGDIIRELF